MKYKLSLIIPMVVLALCLGYLLWQMSTTGLNLDIDLKGGTQIIADFGGTLDEREIENILDQYDANIRTAGGIGGSTVFIEFDDSINSEDVLETLSDNGYDFEDYSIQTVGSSLGAASLQQALIVLVAAFAFMAITIFFIFKTPLISLYISLAPAFDIIETLAITQILGIKLSLASFAALLMIIGYSVDDDVMITTRILKGSGEMKDRIKGGYKTSFTTTLATMVALAALYTVSLSDVITQIASVLLIGLLVDLQNTWLFATPLLRWYLERKQK